MTSIRFANRTNNSPASQDNEQSGYRRQRPDMHHDEFMFLSA